MSKIKVGIVGASGYTGGELIRLLIRHPLVELTSLVSSSQATKRVADVHTDLLGDTDSFFDKDLSYDIDVLFLCLGHGGSSAFLGQHRLPNTVKVIDLSQDFRPGFAHDQRYNAVYGLPELNREAIKQAHFVANPGCFATAIQLALLPIMSTPSLGSDLHIGAITGSTGAGGALSPTNHFSWRENNISVYKAFTHQHLKEINHTVSLLSTGRPISINMIPYRGDFTRGILATIQTTTDLTKNEVENLYQAYYLNHPFTWLSKHPVDLKQVVNTNKCLLSLELTDGKLLVVSIIDNLLKGASGQAVQNMNLMFGLPENCGLNLKASVF